MWLKSGSAHAGCARLTDRIKIARAIVMAIFNLAQSSNHLLKLTLGQIIIFGCPETLFFVVYLAVQV